MRVVGLGLAIALLLGFGHPARAAEHADYSTVLMELTFLIQGPNSIGTCFLVGNPHSGDSSLFVLVTAAHVLEEMRGESAIVNTRTKTDQGWRVEPTTIQIRSQGRQLWTKHPTADVAVIYAPLRPNVEPSQVLGLAAFADDALLEKNAIHPGDEVLVLGYPLAQSANEALFPVLRSGRIASYPLLPTLSTKLFLIDFRVFKGNSGGPVYVSSGSNRVLGDGRFTMGGVLQFLMGLVVSEKTVTEHTDGLYETREQVYSLGLAYVVHASLIRQAVEMLPDPQAAR